MLIFVMQSQWSESVKLQVMYLLILVLFLGCMYPIGLYAMILNSESDGDTVKETLLKLYMGVSVWLVLIVTFTTLLI